ncbi:MAG: DNA-directed RNA polymerase subunit omega [Schleiferiaceae bacterium]|jgi:DNA-directed RNA polymerase subunit K/omega|nr:DNA-directed RNA polymerase subunit omega [Schleiferiaceae bacterium]
MDFKKMQADKTTRTHNINEIDATTDNVYEALTIIAKRAEQINDTTREELHAKLEEFASSTESLEEIFENKEQIEVSKFYESLPKPTALALQEWLENRIYFRKEEEK